MRLILLLLTLCSSALADDGGTYIKGGLGLNGSLGASQSLFLGFQGPITSIFIWQMETGAYYVDNQMPSIIGLLGGSAGISVGRKVYGKLLVGPSVITATDSRLPSNFQFNDDFEIGIRDGKDYSLGLNYKHISNAGLTGGNGGRNFLMLKLQVPF